MTPENIRFHAAGHLAAAALLVKAGNYEGSRVVMQQIEAYVQHPKVQCPPRIKEMVRDAIVNPQGSLDEIETLEKWFVDPLNSKIEASQNGG